MFFRRKSKNTELEDRDVVELLKHMHQLDRTELIARIQQRDQYIVCIIGAFIAFLVGLIQIVGSNGSNGDGLANTSDTAVWILLGCLVAWFLMVTLTYRLINSYDIHDQLIEHTKEIDTAFKEKYDQALPVEPWQEYIDSHRHRHRENSYNFTVISFIIADVFSFVAWIYVTSMEIGSKMNLPNVFPFSISMSVTLAVVTLLYLWERNLPKKHFDIMPTLSKKLLPFFRKALIFILPLLLSLLPFLFQSMAQHQAISTEDPSWLVKLADIIMLALLLVTNKIVRTAVSGFAKPAYETEHNDSDVILANYTGTCLFYIVFCFHYLTIEDAITWIAFLLGGYFWVTGFSNDQFDKFKNGMRLQGPWKTVIAFIVTYVFFWLYLEEKFSLPPAWFDAAFVGAAAGIVFSLVPMGIIAKVFGKLQSSSKNDANAKSNQAQEYRREIHLRVSVVDNYPDKKK